MRLVSVVFATLVCLVASGVTINACYNYDNDIDSLIDRSQVAADREDMHKYMSQLKTNLEKYGATEGHTALLWKTNLNDLGQNYRAVRQILVRLDSIKDISKSDTAYQVALDDIRGTIRELPNPGMGLLWVNYWWVTIFGIFGVWLVPFLAFMYTYPYKRKRARR